MPLMPLDVVSRAITYFARGPRCKCGLCSFYVRGGGADRLGAALFADGKHEFNYEARMSAKRANRGELANQSAHIGHDIKERRRLLYERERARARAL